MRGEALSRKGAPLLWVLLPGLDGTGKLFDAFTKNLPTGITSEVISYPSDQYLSYDTLLSFVRRSLPESATYVLIAESFSSPIAIRVARSARENLKALVLCAGFVSNPSRWYQRLGFILCNHLGIPTQLVRWGARRYLFGTDASEELIKTFCDVLAEVHPYVLASRTSDVFTCNVKQYFQELRLPLLYLSGLRDPLLRSGVRSQMIALQPEMKVRELDCSHFILQTRPREAVKVIQEFINELQ